MDEGQTAAGETLERALRLLKDGEMDEAGTLSAGVLADFPGHPGALHLMGVIHARRSEHDTAVDLLTKAAQARPDNADVLVDLAAVFFAAGRFDEAARTCGHAIRLAPAHAVAHLTHGNALHRLRRPEEAAAAFALATHFVPELSEAHFNLGNALRDLRRLEEAAQSYRRAIALQPGLAQAHHNLGSVQHAVYGPEAALAAYMKAVEIAPAIPGAFHNLGVALLQLGSFEDAAAAFRKAITQTPDFTDAYLGLSQVATLAPDDTAVAAMAKRLEDAELPRPDRIALSFAMGNACDGQERHAEAFDHILTGNRLMREDVGFDEDAVTEAIERLLRTFDGRFFADRAGWGCPTELPVFVIGMPRTGRGLVQKFIARHPRAQAGGDMNCLRLLAARLRGLFAGGAPFPECLAGIKADHIEREGEAFAQALTHRAQGAERIVDTAPDNILLLGLVGLLMPRARIVYCVRNPLETCLACFFSRFAGGSNAYAYDLAELGRYHRRYRDLMDHWRAVLPNPIWPIEFTDLTTRPREVGTHLLGFSGLDDAGQEFDGIEAPPLRPASRWPYDEYLAPLKEALGAA